MGFGARMNHVRNAFPTSMRLLIDASGRSFVAVEGPNDAIDFLVGRVRVHENEPKTDVAEKAEKAKRTVHKSWRFAGTQDILLLLFFLRN
jgi:hypothetical protein